MSDSRIGNRPLLPTPSRAGEGGTVTDGFAQAPSPLVWEGWDGVGRRPTAPATGRAPSPLVGEGWGEGVEQLQLIVPDWPAPATVRAASTTRHGGISPPPYDRLNLAEHVGDDQIHVAENRRRLAAAVGLPGEPAWLEQVHGVEVVAAESVCAPVAADATWTREAGRSCVVMTADCLPVLLCDRAGTVVAAAHGGWRGLAGGVIAATVARLGVRPADLLAWLGPAIGPDAFEVGEEVRAVFLALDAGNAGCFRPSPAGRWLADLYELAGRQLRDLGVNEVYGGGWCTFSEPERFFSYRRENRTGRMATLVWLAAGS